MIKKKFLFPLFALILTGSVIGCPDTSLQNVPPHRERKGMLCECLREGAPIKNKSGKKNIKAGTELNPTQESADKACRDRVQSLNSENYFSSAIPETEVSSVPVSECQAMKNRPRGKRKGGGKR